MKQDGSSRWRDQPTELRDARQALARRIGMTRRAIVLERLLRAFWPFATLAMLAFAALQFGLHAVVPPSWLWPGLIALALLAMGLMVWGVRRFAWPVPGEAEARMDDDLPGRPLSSMDDRQALGRGDPEAQRVWVAHLRRVAKAAASAKAVAPDLRLAKFDIWGLRLIGLTAVFAAIVFARGDGAASLQGALLPDSAGTAAISGPSLEAWANPPAHTGKPALYLTELPRGEPVSVPAGTEVTVRHYGAAQAMALSESVSVGGGSGFAAVAEGVEEAVFAADRSGTISAGSETWDITVVADLPPTIALSEPVGRSGLGAMELRYAASDDYGVVEAWVEIELDLPSVHRVFGLVPDPVPREMLVATLPLPATGGRSEIADTLVEDFSRHPWANLPVKITLFARDGAGQSGSAVVEPAELPGRRFFDPLAASFVEMRRDLLWSPENAPRASNVMKSLTTYPDALFADSTDYLLARMAIRRLDYAREDGLATAEIDDIADLLWYLALRIEEGDLSDALAALQRAKDRLSEAMRNGASDEELARLMEDLREATENYMQQLAQEALENGETQQSQNQEGQMITDDQIQQMMDEIERLAREGRTEEAQALLEQLQQMMENMQMTLQEGQGQPSEQQQTMQELQDMMRQQQELADDAFRQLQEQFQQGRQMQPGQQGQQGQNGQQGQPGQGQGLPGQSGQGGEEQQQGQMGNLTPGDLAGRQGALRQLLEELRNGMPGASGAEGEQARRALEDAERNMDEAQDLLEGEEYGEALDRQGTALDNMREAMRGLNEEARQAEGSQGRQPGEGTEESASDGRSRDPLGRPTGTEGSVMGQDAELPGADAFERARELLEEIRRRAGEQERPVFELDYLRRLLDRF